MSLETAADKMTLTEHYKQVFGNIYFVYSSCGLFVICCHRRFSHKSMLHLMLYLIVIYYMMIIFKYYYYYYWSIICISLKKFTNLISYLIKLWNIGKCNQLIPDFYFYTSINQTKMWLFINCLLDLIVILWKNYLCLIIRGFLMAIATIILLT